MTIFLSVFHIIVCVILVAVILLQVGRGHGLTGGSFGGDSTQTILGTKTTTFMTRMTTCAAIGFLITSLTLDIVISRKSKSLLLDTKKKVSIPTLPEGVTVTTKDGEKIKTAVTTKDGRVVKTVEKKVVKESKDEVPPSDEPAPPESENEKTN